MKVLSYLFGIFLLASCAVQDSTDTFNGKEYKLDNAPNDAEITIGFSSDGARFFGNAGVNLYFGSIKTFGDKLILQNTGTTMMMGPRLLMQAESEYLKFINGNISYKLSGNKLILQGKDKTLEFTFSGEVKE